jgi:hypothetical protein
MPPYSPSVSLPEVHLSLNPSPRGEGLKINSPERLKLLSLYFYLLSFNGMPKLHNIFTSDAKLGIAMIMPFYLITKKDMQWHVLLTKFCKMA